MDGTMIVKNKSTKVIIVLFILLVFTAILCLCLGSVSIPVSSIFRLTMHYIFGSGDISDIPESYINILFTLRLPRLLLAFMVGGALSVSGLVMQAILNNSLADGAILGISSGASLGAVIGLSFGITIPLVNNFGVSGFAAVFAFLSLAIVIGFSSFVDKSLQSHTVILTGVIYSMFTSSLMSLILVFLSADKMKQIVYWTMGSFSAKSYNHVITMAVVYVLCIGYLLTKLFELNALSFGETEASHVGVNVKSVKLKLLVVVSVLVGVSVSLCGIIGFVGLIIPHIARKIAGQNHFKLMPLSLFSGGIFLMAMDLLSRYIIPSYELPIGITTSIIGSIFFVVIFIKNKH